jgi:26S proteasome non-ATPase regulatory subunit 9
MSTTPFPAENPRERANQLMESRSNIEAELEAHFSILKANDVTMETPLIDREGFPRADVDIYAVRGARKRIVELRNDLKAIMEEMATALESIYALPEANGVGSTSSAEEEGGDQPKPFARVDGVAPNSPASDAVRAFTISGSVPVLTSSSHPGITTGGPHHQVWRFVPSFVHEWVAAALGQPCWCE